MIDKRNADYLEITRRLEFPIDAPALSSVLDEEQLVSISASIFETDVLIWLVGPNHDLFVCSLLTDSLGRFVFCEPVPPMFFTASKDLNYRIDLPDSEVRELIGDNLLPHNRDALQEYDQVRLVIVKRPHPHLQPS